MTDKRGRNRSCATCDYWDPGRAHPATVGQCRRLSPHWDPEARRPDWPITYHHSWCGDWRDMRPPHSANPGDAAAVASWPEAKQVADLEAPSVALPAERAMSRRDLARAARRAIGDAEGDQ